MLVMSSGDKWKGEQVGGPWPPGYQQDTNKQSKYDCIGFQ